MNEICGKFIPGADIVGNDNPVGVFDSGVGGLSVLRWIRAVLPSEHLLYLADSLYAPYGEKDQTFIERRVIEVSEFLVSQGAKAIVVACNTATVVAIKTLRNYFAGRNLPIIGIEPGVKPAFSITKAGVVGVMATTRTVNSPSFQQLINRFANGHRVVLQACPGLVEQVENGLQSADSTRVMVQTYVDLLLDKGVDTIVLGCTHYPHLLPLIKDALKNAAGHERSHLINVVDTGEAVAKEVKRRLEKGGLCNTSLKLGREQFWSSSEEAHIQKTIGALWGNEVEVLKAVVKSVA